MVRRLHRQLHHRGCRPGNDNYAPTSKLTGGVLPAATWAKYMRVAMAYEAPIPLPGLPPPPPTDEQLIADTGAAARARSRRFRPARLSTAATLGWLEERFKKAVDADREAALESPPAKALVPQHARREAALGEGEPANQ